MKCKKCGRPVEHSWNTCSYQMMFNTNCLAWFVLICSVISLSYILAGLPL
jgi:hypothetical protein